MRIHNCIGDFRKVDIFSEEEVKARHSKLHLLFEKGVKARIIAIGDYFSQCVLSPFHDLVASVLKTILNDATFDQDAGFQRVMLLTQTCKEVHSIDLSKATDRLPLKLQVRLMAMLLGDEVIAELWGKVIADRDFTTETGERFRYAVGQPMGFKSSFPMLGLLHHVIVMEAAAMAGLEKFRDYVILGDDIVIGSTKVADNYKSIMKRLGLALSPNKSILPSIQMPAAAEFCSRLCVEGVEVTPLPLTAILRSMSDQSSIPGLWDILGRRRLFKGMEY